MRSFGVSFISRPGARLALALGASLFSFQLLEAAALARAAHPAVASPAPAATPSCAPGDFPVIANPATKLYVKDVPATYAKFVQQGVFGSDRRVCRSTAKKMGARWMTPAEVQRMGHP